MRRRQKHKFGAIQVEYDGYKFPSKKEGRYYQALKLRQKSGEILFFLRQVPIHIPGGVTMRVDFLEFHANGEVVFMDTKGMKTQSFIDKKKIIEATYPIEIETI